MRDPNTYIVEIQEIEDTGYKVPIWIKDVDIDDNMRHDNAPSVRFRYDPTFDPFNWHGKVWNYDSKLGMYYTEHSDGRFSAHYAGAPYQDKDTGDWVTEQEQGYAGRHFKINMEDGRIICLRGPWYGVPPEGYEDVTIMPTKDLKDKFDPLGYFGLCMAMEPLLKAVQKFQPDWLYAKIIEKGKDRERFEFVPKDNQLPKLCRRLPHIKQKAAELRLRIEKEQTNG